MSTETLGKSGDSPVAEPPEPTRSDWSRRVPSTLPLVLVGILLFLHAGLAWRGRQAYIETGQDDAWYLLLGRALRQFRYVDLFAVGEPTHQLYPPVFPSMLAVVSAVVGENLDALIVISVLMSTAAIAVGYFAARRLLGGALAVAVVAALVFNPRLLQSAGSITSEPLFMLLTVTSLFLLMDQESARRRFASGGLAIAAALTRSIGIALLAGVALHWLLRRCRRSASLLALASIITVGLWFGWTAVAPDQFVGKSYVADAESIRAPSYPLPIVIAGRAILNAAFYLARAMPAGLAVPTIQGTIADNLVIVVLLIVGLAAGLLACMQRWRSAALSLIAYAAILLIWPWRVERFLDPLLPLLLPVLLLGIVTVSNRLGPRWAHGLASGFALALAVNGFSASVDAVQAAERCQRDQAMPPDPCLTPDQISYFSALRYIRHEVPEQAVVGATKAAPLYYYTGRRTPAVGALLRQSSESFLPFLTETRTAFVLLGRLNETEATRLLPLVTGNCNRLELEAEFAPSTFLFRVPDPGARPTNRACEAVARYRDRWAEASRP